MSNSVRRDQAREIIVAVIDRVGRDDEKALRRAISAAYPWGERAMHPYRIWLSEVKHQMHPEEHVHPPSRGTALLPGQGELL